MAGGRFSFQPGIGACRDQALSCTDKRPSSMLGLSGLACGSGLDRWPDHDGGVPTCRVSGGM